MRKKYLSALLFGAILVTSTGTFTSCKDYDDDINSLKEQINDMTSNLDLTKTELKTLLETSISTLEASINDKITGLPTNEDLQSVKDQITQNVATLNEAINSKADDATVQAAVEELKNSIAAFDEKLETAKDELQGQIDELSNKIQNTVDPVEFAELQEQLATALNDMKLLEDNLGGQIATAQNDIENIKSILGDIENLPETLNTLEAGLTGKITSAISSLKNELLAEDGAIMSKIADVEAKIQNYVLTEDQSYIDLKNKVDSLETWKDSLLESTLKGYVTTTTFTEKVSEIEGLISDLNDKVSGLEDEIANLEEQIKAILGNMIQSVTIEPNYYLSSTGQLVKEDVEFKKLNLYKNRTAFETVGENITSIIKLKVTPIAAAAEFASRYNVSFEGYKVQSRAASNYLKAEYNENESDLDRGVVAFTVSRDKAFADNGTYCLSARFTPAASMLSENNSLKDFTEISSDYFIAKHSIVKIDDIKVTSDLSSSNAYEVKWNDANASYDLSEGRVLKGYYTGRLVAEDLVAEYGDKFEVVYTLTDNTSGFKVDGTSVKIADPTASSKINGTTGINATVSVPSLNDDSYNKTNSIGNITFKVVKDEVKYTNAAIGYDWKTIATANEDVDLNLSSIANTFRMSVNDLKSLLGNNNICSIAYEVNGTTSTTNPNTGVTVTANSNGINVAFTQNTEVESDYKVIITLKDENSSVTSFGSEYTIVIPIKKTTYPQDKELDKDPIFWNADGSVQMATRVDDFDYVGNLTVEMDIRTLFTDFAGQIDEITENKGNVEIDLKQAVTGVTFASAAYPTDLTSDPKVLSVDKSIYTGSPIVFTVTVSYGTKSENTKKMEYSVTIADLTGTLTVNTNKLVISDKNESTALTGFKWVDKDGRVMWENGIVVDSGNPTEDEFKSNPFNIYEMDAPSFTVVDPNQLVEYTDGTVKLTDKGKNYTYNGVYNLTLKMTVKQPKWGELSGLASYYDEQTDLYIIDIPVAIDLNN